MPELLLFLTAPQWVIYVTATVAVLGILVFVHEFGHYFVAKLCGVRVEVFSLGFGKRLWGFRRGETDYRVSLLPIGGYVKMAGENPLENRTGDPGEFTSHPRWQRFLVAIAGPAMNILLALGVLTFVNVYHHEYAVYAHQPAEIGWIVEGSAAEKAGLQPHDTIVRIQELRNPTWDNVMPRVLMSPDQPLDVSIRRGNQVLERRIVPSSANPDHVGDAGWQPQQPVLVGDVTSGRPAERAGIRVGDIIVAINGKPVDNMGTMIALLQEIKSAPAEIAVLRDGQTLKFHVSAVLTDQGANGGLKYRIGVGPADVTRVEQLPLRRAFTEAYGQCKEGTGLIFQFVKKLLEYKMSVKSISSPIGIGREVGYAATVSPWRVLFVMAIISLQLAIFNMFPIPILDGGLMLMLLIEGLMRRDIKQEIKERVYQLAFVFLLLFAAVVIFNDVAKSF